MPITPFLRNHSFDPDQIKMMAAAFQDACTALGLGNRTDPTMETVAIRIIELAKRGICTQTELYQCAIENFKPYTA
jgi:hypothetical protein